MIFLLTHEEEQEQHLENHSFLRIVHHGQQSPRARRHKSGGHSSLFLSTCILPHSSRSGSYTNSLVDLWVVLHTHFHFLHSHQGSWHHRQLSQGRNPALCFYFYPLCFHHSWVSEKPSASLGWKGKRGSYSFQRSASFKIQHLSFLFLLIYRDFGLGQIHSYIRNENSLMWHSTQNEFGSVTSAHSFSGMIFQSTWSMMHSRQIYTDAVGDFLISFMLRPSCCLVLKKRF